MIHMINYMRVIGCMKMVVILTATILFNHYILIGRNWVMMLNQEKRL